MNPKKIVVLTGAGISAPSGLATFRAQNGLWNQHRIEDVATPEGWARNPALVLDFYNQRRAQCAAAEPNAGHSAIAALEAKYEVVVVTQNVDNLHERAGSTRVIHLHGELTKVRSTIDPAYIVDVGSRAIHLGERCPNGGQLRPHIVWFGEEVPLLEDAIEEVHDAGKLLVVGTSLAVYPAAGLIDYAPYNAEKVIVDVEIPTIARGFEALQGSADAVLPGLAERWLDAHGDAPRAR
jgi:NAD-dependent deacetylase